MSRQRKIANHLVSTNYNGIQDKIKTFKKRRATKGNNNK